MLQDEETDNFFFFSAFCITLDTGYPGAHDRLGEFIFHCSFGQRYIVFLACFYQILRTLNRTYVNMKQKPVWSDLNPKAVTTDELFGFIHHATREWKDGKCSHLK